MVRYIRAGAVYAKTAGKEMRGGGKKREGVAVRQRGKGEQRSEDRGENDG